jgi:hypothetical protein
MITNYIPAQIERVGWGVLGKILEIKEAQGHRGTLQSFPPPLENHIPLPNYFSVTAKFEGYTWDLEFMKMGDDWSFTANIPVTTKDRKIFKHFWIPIPKSFWKDPQIVSDRKEEYVREFLARYLQSDIIMALTFLDQFMKTSEILSNSLYAYRNKQGECPLPLSSKCGVDGEPLWLNWRSLHHDPMSEFIFIADIKGEFVELVYRQAVPFVVKFNKNPRKISFDVSIQGRPSEKIIRKNRLLDMMSLRDLHHILERKYQEIEVTREHTIGCEKPFPGIP